MEDVVIQALDISKMYRLGSVSTGSLRYDMKEWWSKNVLGKVDQDKLSIQDGADHIWALKNINFEIRRGEVWGFIGANGAGKSTLLKIISKIVKPTRGVIRGKGRISSLLEVGTGFHNELTGRENIFLSGYILGMKRADILKNFDAIVSFSGISKYIDTPVKRYSSGMYVRLAFAIAAHLEPDVLIVDEVLAVGDAEFQKKCLGKMHEVSQQDGRTILFVSHNAQAIKQLCTKALWLEKGALKAMGDVHTIVNSYVNNVQKHRLLQEWKMDDAPGNEFVKIMRVELLPQLQNQTDPVDIRTPFSFKTIIWNNMDDEVINLGLHLYNYSGECIFDVMSEIGRFQQGEIKGECYIPGNLLNDGAYYLSLIIVKDTSVEVFYLEECLSFEVSDFRVDMNWHGKWMGAVRPQLPFSLIQANH